MSTDETLLVAGVGFGKAIVGLTAVQELLEADILERVLVLAPLRVAQLTWASEADNWSHITMDVALACGTPAQRKAAVESGARIVVTNFENMKWMLDNYGDVYSGVLIDEMSKLKTAGGAGVKRLRRWTNSLKWRVGMSATPVAESGVDIYSQALLLDLGKALGGRKDDFLRRYFYPTDFQQFDWQPLPGSETLLADRLKNLVFTADDAHYKASLPPVIEHVVPVDMPAKARLLYLEMKTDDIIESLGQEIIAANAAVATGKMQQICCGGIYDNDGNLAWSDDFKIQAMLDLMKKLEGPVILVYQFSFELERLRALFPDAPVLGAGGTFTLADQQAWNAGEVPVLIGHPKSFWHGLNIQFGGRHMVYLGPLWSADGWAQIYRSPATPWLTVQRDSPLGAGLLRCIESRVMSKLAGKALSEAVFMDALKSV